MFCQGTSPGYRCCLWCIPGRSGSAHGPGEAGTWWPGLRDDDVPGAHPVNQDEVHAVYALIEHQRLGRFSLDAVGSVAEDEHRYPMALAQANDQVHHRAAVRVDQYSGHGPPPSTLFSLTFSVVWNTPFGKDKVVKTHTGIKRARA